MAVTATPLKWKRASRVQLQLMGNLWLAAALLIITMQCIEVRRFLVDTDVCRIEALGPYDEQVHKVFRRVNYKSCSTWQPLTWVEYNESLGHYQLWINRTAFQRYLQIDLDLAALSPSAPSCCYMPVERRTELAVDLGDRCREFQSGVQLPADTVGFIVQCHAGGKLIYTDGHATVPEREQLRQRLQQWAGQRGVPSVLIIGIDTVSRLQLMRAMPKTRQYLDANGWFEMAGYNKVADNTFPNVLALTAGLNRSSVAELCDPEAEGGLDRCEFIWKAYQDRGYVTAFGEDDTPINTFNYLKRGFLSEPVDYYLRPYMQAAEHWLDTGVQWERQGQSCLGHKYAAEHVYDYALEFAHRYRNATFFGFFWTNTHSHGGSLSRTSAMDAHLRGYLRRLVRQGTMERSVVVLLSDHGMRQGATRLTPLGWLEERLPFLYIWLPADLRRAHPEFVRALRANRRQLTSPYDMHATLTHILRLDELPKNVPDCPRCQSLLQPLPANRTCADAGIAEHWCACWTYSPYTNYSRLDLKMARLMMQRINSRLERQNGGLCPPLRLLGIWKALRAQAHKGDDPEVSLRRLQVRTLPNESLYEATIRYNASSEQILITGISRLDEPKEVCYLKKSICECR